MLVREVVSELLKFPQDHELMDEDAEQVITGFRMSSYDDADGVHDYVLYETTDSE